MNFLKDRRVLMLGGMAVALVAGLIVAFLLVRKPNASTQASPASQGGLVVETGRDDDIKLDPMRPLRCFVGGQFVGELPLSECAKRNGVATGSLDVGLDPSGALAGANGPSSEITPLPPTTTDAGDQGQAADSGSSAEATASRASAACWRYANGAWTPIGGDFTVTSCAQTLYAGQCARPGTAAYGRWGANTLRLVPGRIEISADNRNFRTLVEQGQACSGAGPG